MTDLLMLLVFVVPFAGAAVTLFLGHRAPAAARACAVLASGIGLVIAVVLAVPRLGEAGIGHLAGVGRVFAATDAPAIELALYVDSLSAVLLLLAGSVALLVQVYSLAYLSEDPRYPSYAALVSIFTGAMSLVVVADDLWVLLIGWELMGACSYFLISHHWELPEARAGAVKAFLMTRTADLGLLFAIIVLGIAFDSYRISTIMRAIGSGEASAADVTLPAVLVLIAVAGKSAQFPFHSWLPDAMPGPTPISALIHAATMVAAGVFLVARMYPLFEASPLALNLLALVAAVTMVLAAFYALGQDDLKRVLAWSTVSQLAYMFGALAVGAWSAGVLHLLAHGAFKALLFLAAGSVVHSVGSTSMARMGGLRHTMPITFVTMTLGFGALAGVVPLAGFFTKDAVIGGFWESATGEGPLWSWLAWLLLVVGVLTAALTMAYAARAWLLVFFGPPAQVPPCNAGLRTDSTRYAAGEPSTTRGKTESPRLIWVPLVLLAVPTVLVGALVFTPSSVFGSSDTHDLFHLTEAAAMTLLAGLVLAGVLIAWRRADRGDPWRLPVVSVLPVDRLYDLVVVRPLGALAVGVRAGERDVVDAYADGAGATVRGLGWVLRRAQNGNVQGYLTAVVIGAAVLGVAAGVLAG